MRTLGKTKQREGQEKQRERWREGEMKRERDNTNKKTNIFKD